MAARENKNKSSVSTTWVWGRDKIAGSRPEASKHVPKAPRWGLLPRRTARERLTLTVTFRGGAECWYVVSARGKHGAFPGVLALHDIMREINEGREFPGASTER